MFSFVTSAYTVQAKEPTLRVYLHRQAKEKGWTVKRDGDKGHRRVVASPKPLQVLEARAIKARSGLAGSGVAWQTCKAVVSSGTQLTPVKA